MFSAPNHRNTAEFASLSGKVSTVPRVPEKFQIPVEHEQYFINGCDAVLDIFQKSGGLGNKKIPDSVLILAFEASSNGAICPGFLGSKRNWLVTRLNRLFGEQGWSTEHLIAGRLSPESAGLELYEKAYVDYFKKNPAEAAHITRNYSDVYDTDPSNTSSGQSYAHQELIEKGRHLHDIAIRRALVLHLGYRFTGESLLGIRGPRSEGYKYSPGNIKFHLPHLLDSSELPAVKPWWQNGSVEEFYQASRRIVVKEFADSSLGNDILETQSRTETYCSRIAARYFLRILPLLQQDKAEMGQLNSLPWMLDRNSFPLSDTGLPRAFNNEEINQTLKSLMSMMEFFFFKASKPEQWILKSPLLGFRFAREFIKLADLSAKGEEISAHHSQQFHYFSDMKVWQKALPFFWKHTYGEGKRPLHLARDAWVVMEYLSYRSELQGLDMEHPKRSVYIPGTSVRASLVKNGRGRSEDLEAMICQLASLATESDMESSLNPNLSTRDIFDKKIKEWISRDDASSSSIWSSIYQQILSQFPEGFKSLVVVDTDGTGKSAQFIASLLEFFAQKEDPSNKIHVLLGGMKATPESPALGVPNLAEKYNFKIDPLSGRHIPDARWPFTFDGYDPMPKFLVEKKPGALVLLLWKSLHLYNQAVIDNFSVEE